MATLALGAIGSAFLGSVGGFVGAAVGGIIDNYLLFPALFPPPNTEGPRVDGISVTSANEGTPMNWPMGPRTRVGGAVLWMSDLEEVANDQSIGKGGGPSNTSYEYYISIAIGFGEAKPQTIDRITSIIADVKPIYSDSPSAFYDAITLYNGSQTSPDPFMVSVLGTGRVPIYKKQAYVVIQRLYLGEFGNRPPNFQATINQASDVSVAELISQVLSRCGFDVSDFDVSNVSRCVRGVNFSGVVTGKDMLERILGTYGVGQQEVDGELRYYDKGREVIIDIDEVHIANQQGVRQEEEFDQLQPDEVSATFVSDDLDLQPGSTRYRDTSRSDATRENQIRFDTPVTLSSAEANEMARRIYWQAFGERRKVSFSLPQRYSHLAGGDVLRLVRSSIGVTILLRTQKVEYGADGRIEVTAVATWPGLFDQDGFGDQSGYVGPGAYVPPDLDHFLADMAAVSIEHTDSPWVYWGVRTSVDGETFRGAVLATSLTGTSYAESSGVTRQATWGETEIGPVAASDTTWDGSSAVVVRVPTGTTLASATDDQVLALQRNVCAIRQRDGEWEIMAFVNATPLGDDRYELTRWLRGLRGTGHLTASHSLSGARVVFLSDGSSGVGAWDATTLFMGSPYYKVVPYLKPVAEVDPAQFAIRGRSMRPFSPALLQVVRETLGVGDENVAITWVRRSKKLLDAFGAALSPLAADESPETYRVRIRVGGSSSPILLEQLVTNATRLDFTQSLRDYVAATNTYGWGEGSGFRVQVTQVSTVVGDSPITELVVGARA